MIILVIGIGNRCLDDEYDFIEVDPDLSKIQEFLKITKPIKFYYGHRQT